MNTKPHALVTGVSSGIGAAIVIHLLQTGWRVTGISRTPVDMGNPDYSHRCIDLSDTTSIANAVAGMNVSALVHAAGFLRVGKLGELDETAHEDMWRVHVLAAERLANALLPGMPQGGRIVLIGSRAAGGVPARSQYGATKAALVAMARAWGAELAQRQITVNVVSPAATDTPMLNAPGRTSEKPKLPPIGRYINPEEVAAAVDFLLSPSAGAITGQQLVICGGASLYSTGSSGENLLNIPEQQPPLPTTSSSAVAPTTTLADEQQVVANRVEAFRVALFEQDANALNKLCADDLSYSHGDGHSEDKATFITRATNGRFVFNALENRSAGVSINGTVATVRFNWIAKQTWKDGKVTDTNMAILMVWLKTGEDWKLLARSATKLSLEK